MLLARSRQETAAEIRQYVESGAQMSRPPADVAEHLIALWDDAALKTTYEQHRQAYHVVDSAE